MTGFTLVGAILGIVGFALALRAITVISHLQQRVERLEREPGRRVGTNGEARD